MIVRTKLTTLAVKLEQLESSVLNDVYSVEDDGNASPGVVFHAGAGAGADIACCTDDRVSDSSQQQEGARNAIESLLVVAETVGWGGEGVRSEDQEARTCSL